MITRMITRLERRVDVSRSLSFSRDETEVKLRERHGRCCSLKKKSGELRKSWLLDLEALKAKECNGHQATIHKNLIQKQVQKKGAKRMKSILGGKNSVGLMKVSVERDG